VADPELAVEGSLPADINGVFMASGPAIHAVSITGGQARYRGDGTQRASNVIRHGGHYLALGDGTVPQEISPDTDPAGPYDFGGGLPLGSSAHPRIDPRSGELVAFRSDREPPYLTWAAIGPDGSVTQKPTEVPGIGVPSLVHDFAITEHYTVFLLGPAIFEPGAGPARWRPELGTRIALVPRSGPGPVIFARLPALWAWHLANAFEDGHGQVVIDFPRWSALTRGADERSAAGGGPAEPHGSLCRATVDLASGTARLVSIDDLPADFPRIDDRLAGRRHQYLTVSAASGRAGGLAGGAYDMLVRYDMETGQGDAWGSGAAIGEVVFAPRPGLPGADGDELDGYYLTVARSPAGRRSWLQVWDAGDFPGPPQARVALPADVPAGQHASWFPLHRS
jgi:carotenoid cleavage dioxygenase-like enzyme